MNVTSSWSKIEGEIQPDSVTILAAALHSVDPKEAVMSGLRKLDRKITFKPGRRVGLVSMGKAAVPMASGLLEQYADRIASGLVVAKVLPEQQATQLSKMKVLTGNHPVPGVSSVFAGEEIIRYLSGFGNGDMVFCLISGGASALVAKPFPHISLDDLRDTTGLLLDCGASIDEINVIRKHLDEIKGGRLAAACGESACVSLILSDVLGDRLDVIASGPTVPDKSTYQDALRIIEKYKLTNHVPISIMELFRKGVIGQAPETPKPGDRVFDDKQTILVGSLKIAMEAALEKARELGYSAEMIYPLLTGEAREVGERLAAFLKSKAGENKTDGCRRCWIAGGESTVTIRGCGIGGRNQELALAAVRGLDGVKGATLITFATDGEDGRSPAAGAVVTGDTLRRAVERGLDPDQYLLNNDSHTFFKALNSTIITGSTGTNVNDLVVLLLD